MSSLAADYQTLTLKHVKWISIEAIMVWIEYVHILFVLFSALT
jgi:hypothetical protein